MHSLPQYRCMFKSMVFDGEFAYKNSINNDRVFHLIASGF